MLNWKDISVFYENLMEHLKTNCLKDSQSSKGEGLCTITRVMDVGDLQIGMSLCNTS